MAKPTGPKPNRLAAEERALEQQRDEILRKAQELERKLKLLPTVMEAQEEQKRELAKRRAASAGRAISPYTMGGCRAEKSLKESAHSLAAAFCSSSENCSAFDRPCHYLPASVAGGSGDLRSSWDLQAVKRSSISSAMASVHGQRSPKRTQYLRAYRFMLLARVVEEKLASLYRAGLIKGGVFLGRGQEALSVSVGINLRKGDIFAPLIRDQAGRMAFGDSVLDTFRTYLGSQLGSMRGRDGNIHRGRPREGYYPMISHLGAMIPVVAGGLMARRFRGETNVVGATCLGDGGTSTGAFHEGLNVAAVEKLPLVVVLANNQYAYSTPNSRQFACKDLLDKAIGYGVKGRRVDGTNLEDCLRIVGSAIRAARMGGGPQLVVGELLRLVGHGEHDDASYVDPRLKSAHLGRDCLKVSEQFLLEKNWASAEELVAWRAEAKKEVDATAAKVQREPSPDPEGEDWRALSFVLDELVEAC